MIFSLATDKVGYVKAKKKKMTRRVVVNLEPNNLLLSSVPSRAKFSGTMHSVQTSEHEYVQVVGKLAQCPSKICPMSAQPLSLVEPLL